MSKMVNSSTNLQLLRVNHHAKLSEEFDSMLSNQSLCDVSLCCGGRIIKAHRVILAANSIYFRTVFDTLNTQSHYPIVFVKDVEIEDLRAILEFMYKGDVTIPKDQLKSLVKSAEHLKVNALCEVDPNTQQMQSSGRDAQTSVQFGKGNDKSVHNEPMDDSTEDSDSKDNDKDNDDADIKVKDNDNKKGKKRKKLLDNKEKTQKTFNKKFLLTNKKRPENGDNEKQSDHLFSKAKPLSKKLRRDRENGKKESNAKTVSSLYRRDSQSKGKESDRDSDDSSQGKSPFKTLAKSKLRSWAQQINEKYKNAAESAKESNEIDKRKQNDTMNDGEKLKDAPNKSKSEEYSRQSRCRRPPSKFMEFDTSVQDMNNQITNLSQESGKFNDTPEHSSVTLSLSPPSPRITRRRNKIGDSRDDRRSPSNEKSDNNKDVSLPSTSKDAFGARNKKQQIIAKDRKFSTETNDTVDNDDSLDDESSQMHDTRGKSRTKSVSQSLSSIKCSSKLPPSKKQGFVS